MRDHLHIVCPHCNAVNRIPAARLGDGPGCGKCHRPLFNHHPVELNGGNFQKYLTRNDTLLVVDFWAPWCGPCKMMAPAFEQACTVLEPHARLAKLNTEEEQMIAGQYGIRSIPTLVIFKNGREVARQSGAMNAAGIQSWVSNYL